MVQVVQTRLIGQVTGVSSMNRTDELWGVHGTDLGFLWDAGPGPDGRKRVFCMFGDTYGPGWGGFGAGPRNADWRTNTLFSSTDTDLDDGLYFDACLSRSAGGASQAIPRSRLNPTRRYPFPEHTMIPNSGITVDGVHHVHWMSVLYWGDGGRWRTFQSGIASSFDDGRTWSKPLGGHWPNPTGRNRFQIGAFTRDEEWVYLFGTTNGRWGPAYLARVAPDRVARVGAYQYFDGAGWQPRQHRAAAVLPGPVGEMSVVRHSGLGLWLAMYLDESRAQIVLRSAPEITGPWSDAVPVASGTEFPALYGGFMHPWGVTGNEMYWVMSQWGPYNVFWMRSELGHD